MIHAPAKSVPMLVQDMVLFHGLSFTGPTGTGVTANGHSGLHGVTTMVPVSTET